MRRLVDLDLHGPPQGDPHCCDVWCHGLLISHDGLRRFGEPVADAAEPVDAPVSADSFPNWGLKRPEAAPPKPSRLSHAPHSHSMVAGGLEVMS